MPLPTSSNRPQTRPSSKMAHSRYLIVALVCLAAAGATTVTITQYTAANCAGSGTSTSYTSGACTGAGGASAMATCQTNGVLLAIYNNGACSGTPASSATSPFGCTSFGDASQSVACSAGVAAALSSVSVALVLALIALVSA